MSTSRIRVLRRAALQAAAWTSFILVTETAALRRGLAAPPDDDPPDEDALIKSLTGRKAAVSSRVRLQMPPVFGNGYSVPLTLEVDSPMTEADHVRLVRVLAPRNPFLVVANFRFTPQSGRAAVSTRIRLAQPQNVLAVAEMSDGALLMARTWVKVSTNGCA